MPASATPTALRPSGLGYLAMALAAGVWTLVVVGAAVWRHEQFLSHRYDLGNMVQAVWSTTQGRPLEMTDATTGEQITRLGAHVDPILALLAPLWWIHPEPELLLVVQAAALAAGIYPAVRLALAHTRSSFVAGMVGAWYLVFPWIVWNAFDDFHPVTLAIPLLLYAIWFLEAERFVLFGIAAGLALLTGELVGLTVAGLGLWHALGGGRRLVGGAIAGVGIAWTVLCFAVIVPAFNDGDGSRYYERLENVGGSPSGLVETLFTDPGAVLAELTSSSDLRYIVWLLLPTAFLALLTPLLLLAALPQLGINLIAAWTSATLPWFHYVATIVPIAIAATIVALGRFTGRRLVVAAGAPILASCVILLSYPPRPGAVPFIFPDTYSSAHRRALRDAVQLVPPAVPVAATNRLGAHLSERRVIQLFPELTGADWAVVDTQNPWLPGVGEDVAHAREFASFVQRLDDDPAWELRFARNGVRVYERTG